MSKNPHPAPFAAAPLSAGASRPDERAVPSLPSISTDSRFGAPHAAAGNGTRAPEVAQVAASPSRGDYPMSEPTSSRSLKMHSILNHSGSTDKTKPPHWTQADARHAGMGRDAHRRPNEMAASAPRPQAPQQHNLPPMSELPHFAQEMRPADASEGAQRAFPPNTTSHPSQNVEAKKSPFASTTNTPLNGTPNGMRATYPFPPQSAASTERRVSDPNVTAPQSQSNSPTTSYSSFSHTAKNSPASLFNQTAAHGHVIPAYAAPPQHGGHFANDAAMRGVPGGHVRGMYQLMTLDTGQGPIQVPVDMQAASKMADEKRRRNAGASARFRQRRKEKEREASQTISRLETQLRELAEQKDYYKMERDYFRNLVYQSGAQIHISPRMPSPKPGQMSAATSDNGSSDWQQSGERGNEEGRNQRRRISAYGDVPVPSPGYAATTPAGPQYAHPPAYAYGRQETRPAGGSPTTPLPPGGAQPPHFAPQPQAYDRMWKPGPQ